MAGIFLNGVWSMGFDMDPSAAQIFTRTPTGSASSAGTPFGRGYSWVTNGTTGITLGTNLATLIFGIRFNPTGMPGTSGILFQWFDSTGGAAQVTLRVFNDGHLQFYLGSGTGTPIGSASAANLIRIGVWSYLECKVTINSSTGLVECRQNGVSTPIITASGVNTQSTANAWVNALDLESPTGGNVAFDDWYMEDTTGTPPLNTYLGNVEVRGDKSSANSAVGGRNAWTPTNPQNDNHLNVGNVPANPAQYNSDATPGDYDMFQFPSLTGATNLFFLNEWALVELDAAGARTIELDCYSGGTDNAGTPFTPSAGSLAYQNQPYVVDPNTSAAWTVAAAQAAELGVKVVS